MPLKTVLRKDGMVGTLFELNEGDKSFTQIRYALRLSMSTILVRLREAEAYDLIERNVGTTEKDRIEVKYTLTDKGKSLISNLLKDERISKLIDESKRLKERAYEIEGELLEALSQINLDQYIG